jgi:hypothetical protein
MAMMSYQEIAAMFTEEWDHVEPEGAPITRPRGGTMAVVPGTPRQGLAGAVLQDVIDDLYGCLSRDALFAALQVAEHFLARGGVDLGRARRG